jgi:hypothetical protein
MALVLGGRSLDERMTVVVVVAFFFRKGFSDTLVSTIHMFSYRRVGLWYV